MAIDLSDVHPVKAYWPIFVMVVGREMEVGDVQSLKMLEPIIPNPNQVGIKIEPIYQLSTRTARWHNDAANTPTPNITKNSLASTAASSIGCKPFILNKACSHSMAKPYYIYK